MFDGQNTNLVYKCINALIKVTYKKNIIATYFNCCLITAVQRVALLEGVDYQIRQPKSFL